MELVCGSSVMNFTELQKATTYDGFEADDKFIVDLWEILHNLSDNEKRKFLFFFSGSDRIPVGGLGKLKFVVARNGGDRLLLYFYS